MPGHRPFLEVADRVFVARYPEWDVNVGLVVGSAGALVVDTRGSLVQGREAVEDIVGLQLPVPVTTVVNTHVHFDHTFGNGAFTTATIHAHERVAAAVEADAVRLKAQMSADRERLTRPAADAPDGGQDAADDVMPEQDLDDLLATAPRRPDITFATTTTIDLGDRVVELHYAGRGHTDGDIAVLVPDAAVTFLGDLVEESAPPALGEDSWPLDWAATLDAHHVLLGDGGVVLPGHGVAVDAAFVARQRDDLATLATVIRERHAARVPLAAAQHEPDARLTRPLDGLVAAFARGYAQLDGLAGTRPTR